MARNDYFRRNKTALIFIIITALIAGVFSVNNLLLTKNEVLPNKIKSQISFSAFIPKQKNIAGFELLKETFKYGPEGDTNILTYTLKGSESEVVITQQPYPEILVYEKLVNSMKLTKEISSRHGTISITKPQGDRTTAVMNSNGVLLFALTDKNLADSVWRDIINSLELTQ